MINYVKNLIHKKSKYTIICFCLMPILGAVEFHVSPRSGKDSNQGSAQAPFASVARAVQAAHKGGDIYLHAGTYTKMINVDFKGQVDKWLRIKRFNNEAVVLQAKPHGMVLSGSHIEIDGIAFTNIPKNGIVAFADQLKIRNCRFSGGNLAIKLNDKKKYHRNVLIENCTIYDYYDIAIFPDNMDGLIVRNNFFAFTTRNGVMPQIDPGGVKNLVLDRNIFYYQGKKRGPLKIRTGNAEPFSEEDSFNAYGAIVRRNVFVGGDKYSVLIASSNGVCMYNNTLVNNVNKRVENGLLYIHREVVDVDAHGKPLPANKRPHGPNKNNVFKNNIFYLNAGDKAKGYHKNVLVDMHSSMGVQAAIVPPATKRDEYKSQTFENNLYFKTSGTEYVYFLNSVIGKDKLKGWGAGFDKNGIIAQDPKFTTQDINNTKAFTLASASPCIDAGTDLAYTTEKGSGKTIAVSDARYFTDGLGMVSGDQIRVGKDIVTVMGRDINKHTLSIDKHISWAKGTAINVLFHGKSLDIGASEQGLDLIIGNSPHRHSVKLK